MSGKVTAIIPAAGKSERLSGPAPKVFRELGGIALLGWSLLAFRSVAEISEILVGVAEGGEERAEGIISALGMTSSPPEIKLVRGGEERQDTVRLCLAAGDPAAELVVIHDAARPFVTAELIREVLRSAETSSAATLALRPADTVKLRDEKTGLARNLGRDHLFLIQTPQAFRMDLIKAAHEEARRLGFRATDDTALVERRGQAVTIVPGRQFNFKITTPADWALAQALIRAGEILPPSPGTERKSA